MKHTPGPWKVDKEYGFVVDKNGTFVASSNCTKDLDIDEREANARLITTAPELLEALQLAIEYSENPDSLTAWAIFVDKARAAITKATEEP